MNNCAAPCYPFRLLQGRSSNPNLTQSCRFGLPLLGHCPRDLLNNKAARMPAAGSREEFEQHVWGIGSGSRTCRTSLKKHTGHLLSRMKRLAEKASDKRNLSFPVETRSPNTQSTKTTVRPLPLSTDSVPLPTASQGPCRG